MGSRVSAFILRPVRDYNVENRAHKVIASQKPRVAPKHPTEEKYAKTGPKSEKMPEFLGKKEDHLERLKGIEVVSTNITPAQADLPSGKRRPLPQSHQAWQQYEYGYYEPEVVPEGRITLRQATKMISDAATDPSVWTAEVLARQYCLKREDAENILKYFRVYKIHVPATDDSTMPGKLYLQMESMKKYIGSGRTKKEEEREKTARAQVPSGQPSEKG